MAYCADLLLRGRRPLVYITVLFGMLIQFTACGGDLGYTFEEQTGGSGGDVFPGAGGSSSGGNPFYATGGAVEEGSGGRTPYDEKECPPVAPPTTVHECDPIDPSGSCSSYQSCLPYILYPDREDGCGSPGYGEVCWAAGSGKQGELCTAVGTGCAAGFMCVVGAAGGERCMQICVPGDDGNCPTGLICGETDVLGYGVCN